VFQEGVTKFLSVLTYSLFGGWSQCTNALSKGDHMNDEMLLVIDQILFDLNWLEDIAVAEGFTTYWVL